ncbi:MAG: endolytic transglycosylase MltG [Candidatus Saccharimonadales bacterium]
MNFGKEGRASRFSIIKKTVFITVTVIVLLLIAGVIFIRKSYTDNLKPVSNDPTAFIVTIERGSTTAIIADKLYSKGVIRSDWAFEWYVRNNQLRDELKAGTYAVNKSQSVAEIVTTIVDGKIASDLVTLLPGQRLDQLRAALVTGGFSETEVDAALDPAQYIDHPALTDKPESASLEGYLYPESFQKTAETTVAQVIQLSLDEMAARLTPDVRQAISKQGLTLHQGITLASIVEREVGSPQDRAQVAQVFKKRLSIPMRLESNATDDYAKINPEYNTYTIPALPPGPISNFTESSLDAVAFPAQTDWTYFVSGDDKKTYFSKTLAEHEELIKKHCTTACGR